MTASFYLPVAGRLSLFTLALASLCVPVASADVEEELARAAKSPYAIASFVDSHITFEWEPLWEGLGIHGNEVLMQPCGEDGGPKRDCSEELATVLDPFQVILILRQNSTMFQVYLRFLRPSGPDREGPWKFRGYYSPPVKYFEPRHRTLRFGDKPFLVVTRQGISGTGLASEIDDWIDLSLPEFEPVLSITTQGNYSGFPDGIDRETHATVVPIESDPPERVQVTYHARFTHNEVTLAERWDTAVYVRRGVMFSLDATQTATSKSEIENLYDDYPSDEEYLRLLLSDLKRIATGPDAAQKSWLRQYLKTCRNTAEKRALQALLAKARAVSPP